MGGAELPPPDGPFLGLTAQRLTGSPLTNFGRERGAFLRGHGVAFRGPAYPEPGTHKPCRSRCRS